MEREKNWGVIDIFCGLITGLYIFIKIQTVYWTTVFYLGKRKFLCLKNYSDGKRQSYAVWDSLHEGK